MRSKARGLAKSMILPLLMAACLPSAASAVEKTETPVAQDFAGLWLGPGAEMQRIPVKTDSALVRSIVGGNVGALFCFEATRWCAAGTLGVDFINSGEETASGFVISPKVTYDLLTRRSATIYEVTNFTYMKQTLSDAKGNAKFESSMLSLGFGVKSQITPDILFYTEINFFGLGHTSAENIDGIFQSGGIGMMWKLSP